MPSSMSRIRRSSTCRRTRRAAWPRALRPAPLRTRRAVRPSEPRAASDPPEP